MTYKILVPEKDVVFKDDGNRLVLFLLNSNKKTAYNFYKSFIQKELLDILLNIDYKNKHKESIYDEIHATIRNAFDVGPANDICKTLLSSLYVADCHTGKEIFTNNIDDTSAIIEWRTDSVNSVSAKIAPLLFNRKLLYIAGGIILGILIALLPRLRNDNSVQESITPKTQDKDKQEIANKLKMNAVYDPKICAVYFTDTIFKTIEYYINYNRKVKDVNDINWRLQASTLSCKDTMFLKDNCTVYLKGEEDDITSEIQVIDVSYYDFITELLVTQDPLIKSMLVTNSPTPFGNTTFLVDGIPQQVSYYKSSELTDYIKKGFRVTGLKTISRNLNPTDKRYPRLAKIIIQKP